MAGLNDSYGPCLKCKASTCSVTGLCQACRTVICACGHKFTASRSGTSRCSECRKASHAHRSTRVAKQMGAARP